MSTLVISLSVFFGVAALVGSVAFLLRGDSDQKTEDRLAMLTSSSGAKKGGKGDAKSSVLTMPLEGGRGFLDEFLERFNARAIFEQANMPIRPTQFVLIMGAFAGGAGVLAAAAGLHPVLWLVSGLSATLLPVGWLLFKRRARLRAFAKQLPDALELMARALRAGHSLAAGFRLVADEMADPIGSEFNRVFEEQNLGIVLDEALENMTRRVPNLDLRFFSTAIILQKQTGGDLAEILDKIGYIIRERFKIWGQVQALTGEGRLSGVVLLALPPVLFVVVWRLNPEYVLPLFADPMGRQMLFFGVVMQILGALAIRKIVNIKV